MRILSMIVTGCILGLCSWGFGNATALSSSSSAGEKAFPSPAQSGSKAVIAGFAFVSSQVTSMGSKAQLPAGTKIYPSGSTLTGTEGCPTNQYHTDGEPVVVIAQRKV